MFKKRAYDESMLCNLISNESLERIKARARYDGTNNNPGKDCCDPSATEKGITSSCVDLLFLAKEDAENALADETAVRDELTENGSESRVQQVESTLDNDIYKLKTTEEPHLLTLFTQRIDSFADMRTFRSEHELTHKASYTENRLWAVAILVTLLVMESLLNANMLAKTNIYGIIGGWAEAIFISMANIFFGFFAGIVPTRFSFYNQEKVRMAARVGLAGSILSILFFNFMFAHYRLIGTPDVADLLTVTWKNIKDNPFSIFLDIKSFSLFIVGVTFSGLAAWKGFDWNDRYPFYGRIYRKWLDAKKAIVGRENAIINKAVARVRKAQAEMLKIGKEAENLSAKYTASVNRSQAILQRYDDKMKHLERTHQHLVNTYRETNKEVRDELPPDHFGETINLPKDDAVIDESLAHETERARQLESTAASMNANIDSAIQRLTERERAIIEELKEYFEQLENQASAGRVSAKMEEEEAGGNGDAE